MKAKVVKKKKKTKKKKKKHKKKGKKKKKNLWISKTMLLFFNISVYLLLLRIPLHEEPLPHFEKKNIY